jgi:hypothetical protein
VDFRLIVPAFMLAVSCGGTSERDSAAPRPTVERLRGRVELLEVKPFQPIRTRMVNVSARLADSYSDSTMRSLAEVILDSITKLEPALKGMNLFFYGPHSAGDGACDVAKGIWAPGGDRSSIRTSTAAPEWTFEFVAPPAASGIIPTKDTALGGGPTASWIEDHPTGFQVEADVRRPHCQRVHPDRNHRSVAGPSRCLLLGGLADRRLQAPQDDVVHLHWLLPRWTYR